MSNITLANVRLSAAKQHHCPKSRAKALIAEPREALFRYRDGDLSS